jgi:hypothetical protein
MKDGKNSFIYYISFFFNTKMINDFFLQLQPHTFQKRHGCVFVLHHAIYQEQQECDLKNVKDQRDEQQNIEQHQQHCCGHSNVFNKKLHNKGNKTK